MRAEDFVRTNIIPIDRLRELFYVNDCGTLMRRGNPDRKAGWDAGRSYIKVRVDGLIVYAHRIAYAIHHGSYPSKFIDHINGIKDDNRLCNLRECEYWENAYNNAAYRSNTSGFKGVSYSKNTKSWRVRIRKGRLGTKLLSSKMPK